VSDEQETSSTRLIVNAPSLDTLHARLDRGRSSSTCCELRHWREHDVLLKWDTHQRRQRSRRRRYTNWVGLVSAAKVIRAFRCQNGLWWRIFTFWKMLFNQSISNSGIFMTLRHVLSACLSHVLCWYSLVCNSYSLFEFSLTTWTVKPCAHLLNDFLSTLIATALLTTRLYRCQDSGGYRGGSPTAVQVYSDPALCGSRPLVTLYYCRLGDLLCLFCVYRFVCALLSMNICI